MIGEDNILFNEDQKHAVDNEYTESKQRPQLPSITTILNQLQAQTLVMEHLSNIVGQNNRLLNKLEELSLESNDIKKRLDKIELKLADEEYFNQRILTTLKSFTESNKALKEGMNSTLDQSTKEITSKVEALHSHIEIMNYNIGKSIESTTHNLEESIERVRKENPYREGE